jgi:hypothetical protein
LGRNESGLFSDRPVPWWMRTGTIKIHRDCPGFSVFAAPMGAGEFHVFVLSECQDGFFL